MKQYISPLPLHCDLMNQSRVTVTKVSGWVTTHVTCTVCAGISLNENGQSQEETEHYVLQLSNHYCSAELLLRMMLREAI